MSPPITNQTDPSILGRWSPLLTPLPTVTPFIAPLLPPTGSYRPEPTYHPQVQSQATPTTSPLPPMPSGVTGPYALPAGSTLSQTASGTQAQPFDVTLSQLATAVYEQRKVDGELITTRGTPPDGWSAVTDQQLTERGVTDPQAWRLQHLGFNDTVLTNPQEFRAQVYTDGQGNYVLSYRGTAEGGADWDNNFRQGLGFETADGDKFSVTAVNTAVEFERVFGNNPSGDSTNLAITGHSQGGGLATVGSLASGVPAVTFDASGVHPNTWDRLGIDPQGARNIAEGGQIRAYSLSGDALTRAQDSWITGLVAPDALGTQIVVDPASRDEHNMFTNYGEIEKIDNRELVNTGVELARDPLTGTLLSAPVGLLGGGFVGGLLGGPGGALLGAGGGTLLAPIVTVGGGNVAYAAISHSPNALTNAMIENQPWQPGYENPSSWTRDLQNLLPDTLKDDYARNTNDFVTDIGNVVDTDFANGNYVRGGYRIAGDLAEGFFNSTGDTLDAGIDGVGGLTNTLIDGAGRLGNDGIDWVGNGVQSLGDSGAQGLRDLGNTVGLPGVGNFAGDVVQNGGRIANQGIDLIGDGVQIGADALGTAANVTIDVLGDGVELVADGFGQAAEFTADVTGTVAQGFTDGAKAVGGFLNPFD